MIGNSPVGIALIGAGNLGLDLARKVTSTGRARIVSVSDPDDAARRAAAAEFGASQSPDCRTAVRADAVDAVMVVSPPGLHMEHVITAVAAGKEVYCEKPLAVQTAQCDSMIAACNSAGVGLFVGQVLRLFPLFARSRELLDTGVLGDVRTVSVTRAGLGRGFVHGWRSRRCLAGGLLLEINAHELDYMRFLLGEPISVFAKLDNLLGWTDYEDQGFLLVEFTGGRVGMLHTSLSSPIGEYRVHIQGTLGNMVHGGFSGSLRYQTTAAEAIEVRAEDITREDPYVEELTSWLDAITIGTAPLFTGRDGRMAVAMAEAAYRSAKVLRPVLLSELE